MWTFVRYVIVAVLAYVIDMGGFALLVHRGMEPVVANVIVKVVAAICGFFMHRRFTYQIAAGDEALAHAKRYFGLALLYTPVSSLVLYLLMHVISHPVCAKAVSDVLLFILTYWVTTKFTFSRKQDAH